MPRRSTLFALGVLIGTLGCANKTEQATREAWNSALRDTGEDDNDGPGRDSAGNSQDDMISQRSWEELGTSVGNLSETLAAGVSTVDFDELAEGLCGHPSEPLAQEESLIYNCDPEPTISIDDELLTIELDDSGVVSFIATNITDEESASFLEQAQTRLSSLCAQTWTGIPPDVENAHEEFYSCPLANGTVIAVGRFPRDLDANQWHFSLVVLGPG